MTKDTLMTTEGPLMVDSVRGVPDHVAADSDFSPAWSDQR